MSAVTFSLWSNLPDVGAPASVPYEIRKQALPLEHFARAASSAVGLERWFWPPLCGYNKVSILLSAAGPGRVKTPSLFVRNAAVHGDF